MNVEFWNERYGGSDYFYGTEPNAFLKHVAARISPGPVLCLAEGEGRNAAYLAGLGHTVTAIDQSALGMEKARRLAASRGLHVDTMVTDLAAYSIEPGKWSGIIATFVHLPPRLRAEVHRQVVAGLKMGGVYIMEAYTPAQLAYDTGGPKDPELLMTLKALKQELSGLEIVIGREIERDVREGGGHTGRAAVVQVLAERK
ncbi:MAG: methyltransferase domain-containing protein [Nibricoccus sp.]